MFKYSDLDYDNFYKSEQCQKEDAEIKSILNSVCCDLDSVLDLGAGTGLVSSMVGDKCHVIQVEKDDKMKSMNPFPSIIIADASDFVDAMNWAGRDFDHVVSLFALNYMKLGTLTKAVSLSKGECVFVVYDRPYLNGSASYYRGKKLVFLAKHWLKQKLLNKEVSALRRSGYLINVWNLCGEPYYKVIMIGAKSR